MNHVASLSSDAQNLLNADVLPDIPALFKEAFRLSASLRHHQSWLDDLLQNTVSAPAAFLINKCGDVLDFRGEITPYLCQPQSGQLFAWLRLDLRLLARVLFRRALTRNAGEVYIFVPNYDGNAEELLMLLYAANGAQALWVLALVPVHSRRCVVI